MDSKTIIKLFISSPGEQKENRNIVDEVCNDINKIRGNREGFVIETVKWETHARPGVGVDPQDVIDRQLGAEFDIYVGLMGSRFGTPTSNAGSGTEDEFDTALKSHGNRKLHELLFYFQDPRNSKEKIDAAELLRIQAFQEKLKSSSVFYWKFETGEQFKNFLTGHLSNAVDTVLSIPQADTKIAEPIHKSSAQNLDPLENLNSLGDSEEDGLLELEEVAILSMELFTAELITVGNDTETLGQRFTEITDATHLLSTKTPNEIIKQRTRIFSLTSKYMEDYISSLATSLPKLHEYFGASIDATINIVLLAKQFDEQNGNIVAELDSNIEEMEQSLNIVTPMIESFRSEIEQLPQMSKSISRSKLRLLAVSLDLVVFFQQALSQITNLRSQLGHNTIEG